MKHKVPNLEILEGKERKRIIQILKNQFGIEEISGALIRRGKDRIFLFQGNFGKKEIRNLEKISFVERVGVYMGKEELGGVRLSIEGSQILRKQIKKNIVSLTKNEMEIWMGGHEVLKKSGLKGFVIMKYQDDFLGTGKASEEKITNFIPKSRRLRDKTIEK